jgi:hypothetical protein
MSGNGAEPVETGQVGRYDDNLNFALTRELRSKIMAYGNRHELSDSAVARLALRHFFECDLIDLNVHPNLAHKYVVQIERPREWQRRELQDDLQHVLNLLASIYTNWYWRVGDAELKPIFRELTKAQHALTRAIKVTKG